MKNFNDRLCKSCQKPVLGRSDKKFCDDYCRNSYNNQQKSHQNNYVRKVNHTLLRNRKLLESLLSERMNIIRVHRDKLLDMGFQFQYHTHSVANSKGQLCHYCYEYGYTTAEHEWYLIIRQTQFNASQ